MSSLQISSSQVINSVPTYIIQMTIKTFIEICLTIMVLSFIFCLIIVYKFSQKNKKILIKEDTIKEDTIKDKDTIKDEDTIKENIKEENIKEEKNNLIEEELKNIKLIINLLQDEFHNKITQMEDKNNSILENFLKINNYDTQTQEKHLNNLLIDEYKNLKDEINVLTHKFTYYNSKQDENINLLKEDLRKINMKVVQQHQINQEKNNLLEENIKNISNEVVQQQRIIRNNENQCIRFNSFLDNYSIKCSNKRYTYSIKLNGSISIPLKIIQLGIEISFLRTLHSIGNYINFIEYYEHWNKLQISEYLNSLIINNNSPTPTEISIIDYGNYYYSMTNHLNKYSLQSIPLFMLCLLFGTKIITFDGEDVTDLFEDNFNRIKRYHNSRELSNPESKRISNMCNVEYVREMFK
jgi:hypothetical protein